MPRANRCIFAINELPDLAGKIQVGLFNILQEGDIQIRGYPVRLRLDVAMTFTANPEDYTARGKIVTPLKDRIGSEIRHPLSADAPRGHRHHRAGGVGRARAPRPTSRVPLYVREVVEEIAFQAPAANKKIDGRSGVSQRMPITCLENVGVERGAPRPGSRRGLPAARVADVYAALPAITGKFELEYEGELRGADARWPATSYAPPSAVVFGGVVRHGVDTASGDRVVRDWEAHWISSDGTSAAVFPRADVAEIHGLHELAAHTGIGSDADDPPPVLAAGVEFGHRGAVLAEEDQPERHVAVQRGRDEAADRIDP